MRRTHPAPYLWLVSETPANNERRMSVRIDGRFPLQLRGRDEERALDSASIAINVSRGGLYTRLLRRLEIGQSVFGVVSLPTGSALAARGHVVRSERLTGGGWGIALQFRSARLLADDFEGDDASRPGRVLRFGGHTRSM
jgi:hypothetical protein